MAQRYDRSIATAAQPILNNDKRPVCVRFGSDSPRVTDVVIIGFDATGEITSLKMWWNTDFRNRLSARQISHKQALMRFLEYWYAMSHQFCNLFTLPALACRRINHPPPTELDIAMDINDSNKHFVPSSGSPRLFRTENFRVMVKYLSRLRLAQITALKNAEDQSLDSHTLTDMGLNSHQISFRMMNRDQVD